MNALAVFPRGKVAEDVVKMRIVLFLFMGERAKIWLAWFFVNGRKLKFDWGIEGSPRARKGVFEV